MRQSALSSVLAVFLLMLLAERIGAEPPELRSIQFRCQPADARLSLDVSGRGPFSLGSCVEPISLDLSRFKGQSLLYLTFEREGYQVERRAIQQPYLFLRQTDCYPQQGEGPVRLAPRSDFASRTVQLRLLLQASPLAAAGVLVGGLIGAVQIARWRRRLTSERRRLSQLEALKAALDTTDPLVFKVLGPYRILEPLGAGGMGTVYRAVRDQSLDVEDAVAIKVMERRFSQDEDYRARFQREVRIGRRLQHPNLVSLVDYGEQEGLLYLVMELLRGEPLRKRIPRQGMEPDEMVAIARAIGAGLACAHARGVIHRDLKPDNVFLTSAGQVKIMDFGIARLTGATVLTATGFAMGTPSYMSPEHSSGDLSAASDQYALGVMFYEMLTGAVPFSNPDPLALLMMHAGAAVPPLRERRPEIPEPVEAVVLKMLAKLPERRYPEVSAAVEALERAVQG